VIKQPAITINRCYITAQNTFSHDTLSLKGYSFFVLEIGSFYNSPRVKLLSFIVIESIQPISGSGGTTFSIA